MTKLQTRQQGMPNPGTRVGSILPSFADSRVTRTGLAWRIATITFVWGIFVGGASPWGGAESHAQGAPRIGTDGPLLTYGNKPLFTFGQGDWLMLLKSRADYEAESNWYRQYGANFTRVKTINTFVPDSEGPIPPWSRDHLGRFDLNQPNPTFWFRLRRFLKVNEDNGRFVLLQFFDEVGLERASVRWDNHPFHPNKNVNNLGLPTRDAVPEFYDVNNAPLLAIQDAYVDRLLEETKEFGNIIYEVCNEYTGPIDWLEHWIDKFTAFEQANGIDLVLTNMSCSASLVAFEAGHPGIDVLDLWHAPNSMRFFTLDQIRDRFYTFGGSKPVLTGRIGPEPDWTNRSLEERVHARTIFWTVFFSGGVGACTKEDDTENRSVFGPPLYDEDFVWEDAMAGLHSFIESMGDLSGVKPARTIVQASPASLSLALKADSGMTMVYLHELNGSPGGSFRVTGIPDGQTSVSYFSPAIGFFTDSLRRTVRGGTLRISVPPFERDLVVVIDPTPLSTRIYPVGSSSTTPLKMNATVLRRAGIDTNNNGRRDYKGTITLNQVVFDRLPLNLLSYSVARQTFIEVFQLEDLSFAPGYFRILTEVEDRDGNQGKCVVRFRIEAP